MENNSFKPIIWKNWPVLGPTSRLIFLFFYLLMPSTILKHSSLHEESGYVERKANLEADVRALKEIKENAVCSGDQLVIPKDNKDALLPPINLDTLVNKLEKSVKLGFVGVRHIDNKFERDLQKIADFLRVFFLCHVDY